ncbi:type IV pilus modification PilV family protein [Kiritimatiella glycovorans]|uniref:Cassette protein B, Verrucomicrobia group n=1 Tax=Kiritimatiella glycovorans TaxID=1307763 RepID=A0A0G3EKN4_9BACT|nr:prepilin-type N-terminal cleavage/methylation domain-containing protein [Kiritimatiella glycovorans]AKJ64739.1 cassette protein B, Verrucomicrobia group [Kiritimatiella glycovorans]
MTSTDQGHANRFRKQGKRSGFSLLELVLAIGILSFGLLALFGVFPSGLDAVRKSTEETEIHLFASSVLEACKGTLAAAPRDAWDLPATVPVDAADNSPWEPAAVTVSSDPDWEGHLSKITFKDIAGDEIHYYYHLYVDDLNARHKRIALRAWRSAAAPQTEEGSVFLYTEAYHTMEFRLYPYR